MILYPCICNYKTNVHYFFALLITTLFVSFTYQNYIWDSLSWHVENATRFSSHSSNVSSPLVIPNFTISLDNQNVSTQTMVQNADKQNSIVNPHPYKYQILETDACMNDKILVLAAVISAPQHFKERQLVRETWGSKTYFSSVGLRALFFIGQTADKDVQKQIFDESKIQGDIIQENFIDSYRNLTLKSVMVMRWASMYCSTVPFILKVDIDVFVNSFRLSKFLQSRVSHHSSKPAILCNVYAKRGVIRKPKNKWAVTSSEYPNYKRKNHPDFCSGPAYIITGSLVFPFYNASLFTPFMFLEDVFTTGLVQETLRKQYMVHIHSAYHYYKSSKSRSQNGTRSEFATMLNNDKIIFLHSGDSLSVEARTKAWKNAWNIIANLK